MVIGSSVGPERLASAAQGAEAAGFDELWLAEDFTFTGGISGANIALGATRDIQVGLGVVSAVVRHPAVLAMEVATTARGPPEPRRSGHRPWCAGLDAADGAAAGVSGVRCA